MPELQDQTAAQFSRARVALQRLTDVEARLTMLAEWMERDGDASGLAAIGIPEYQARPGFIRDGFLRMIDTRIAGHPQASPALRTLVRRLITAAEKQAT